MLVLATEIDWGPSEFTEDVVLLHISGLRHEICLRTYDLEREVVVVVVVASFVPETGEVSEIEAGPVDSERTGEAITIVTPLLVESPTDTPCMSTTEEVLDKIDPCCAVVVAKVVAEDKVAFEVTD